MRLGHAECASLQLNSSGTMPVAIAYSESYGEMGKVKKSISRWCWGRTVANKLSINYIKCLFWPQNLMFVTTGCPEQLEKCLKKYLNLHKSLAKPLNDFGPAS